MSFALIQKVNEKQKKHAVVDVRSGKSARLKAVKFDREAVNTLPDKPASKIEETKESDESNSKEDK